MKILHHIAPAVLAACLTSATAAESRHETNDNVEVVTPDNVEWQPGPSSFPKGASMAVLEGDPTSAGRFVLWIRFPDGYQIQPYFHPQRERLTVLSGTLHSGIGENFDHQTMRAIPAGSYGHWPAGTKHYSSAKGETIVQVHGEGPWVINYVNPRDDPRPFRARNVIDFADDTLEDVQATVHDDKAVLVDVRSEMEWNNGHIEGSILVPATSLHKSSLDLDKLEEILPAKREEKTLYTFCVVGMRAKKAAKILQEQGYKVRALEPGYEQLIEAGFEKADEDSRQRDAR